MRDGPANRSSRLGLSSSLRATAASSRCSTGGRAPRARRRRRHRLLPRGHQQGVGGAVRSVAGRRFDHHAARRRAHPRGPPAQPLPGRRSGPAPPPAASRRCATSATPTRCGAIVYATPEYIDTLATLDRRSPITCPVDFELRGCPINKRTAARGGERLPEPAGRRRSPPTACASSASCAATSA